MKYIGISIGDPWDNNTWSSEPFYFFSSLKKYNLLGAIGAENGYLERIITRVINKIIYSNSNYAGLAAQRDTCLSKQISKKINKKIYNFIDNKEIVGVPDAIVSTTTLIDFKNLNYPVFNIMDATWDLYAKKNINIVNKKTQNMVKRIDEYEKSQLHQASGIIAFSEWVKESCVNHYGLDPNKILVAGHGPCIPHIDDFRKIEDDPPYILFVSTSWNRKGGDIVVEAFKKIKSKIPKAKLKVVGRAPENLLKKVEGIEYMGFINKNTQEGYEKFINIFKRASVMILPTKYDPSPNIILEANYAKTPVVASNVDGIPEEIIDGYNGFTVDGFNPDDYADKLLKLLLNNDLRTQMANNSRKIIEERFNWDTIGGNIDNFIHNQLKMPLKLTSMI